MSTLTDSMPRLTLRTTADFLALAPYLLGYHPDERLVAVVLSGQRLAVTAAMEMDAFADPAEARDALMPALERVENPQVMLMAWTSDGEAGEAALGIAETWLEPESVLDSVVVTPEDWWSRTGCCSGETADLEHGAAAAEAVLAGLHVRGSRDDAVRCVDGPGRTSNEPFEMAWEGLLQTDYTAVDALAHVSYLMRTAGELRPMQVAPLVAMVQDVAIRDAVWLAMDIAHADDHLELWRRVVAVTPPDWALVPVLLLGCASWVAGQGAIMVACVERALELDPGCSLAHLLSQVNRAALPPQVWEQGRAQMVFGLPDAGEWAL